MMEKLKLYIHQLFGAELTLAPFDGGGLPYLLQGSYDFQLATLNNQQFILMFDRGKTALTPASIAKHSELVAGYAKLPAVYTATSLISYNRGRLLKRHVPFIVPDRQLYLPFLHAAFTEISSAAPKEFSGLGNTAQLLILGQLNRKFPEPLSIAMAQEFSGYSRISVIRAFDELEFFHLAQRSGASRRLSFLPSGKKLWQNALPLLKNPCRRVVGLEKLPEALSPCVAGVNALARRTLLAESKRREYAVHASEFNRLGYIPVVPKRFAPILLQLWLYSPKLITSDGVDSFSLYLTLKDELDERIQIALDELMNAVLW
ncbi:MAG: hypothetical protein PHG44_07985 [Lentisphaeria bacterium]|nr:hypothetical protein [Lentisphaeria bacterium]MDY0176995.1 hypothetical protein [Lentisphaeria bacterium]